MSDSQIKHGYYSCPAAKAVLAIRRIDALISHPSGMTAVRYRRLHNWAGLYISNIDKLMSGRVLKTQDGPLPVSTVDERGEGGK